MTKDRKTKRELDRLEQVLDTYGADVRRWPDAERAGLQKLVESRPRAKELFNEGRALERVLDAAPAARASDALKACIVAAAASDSEREARVVPIAAGKRAVSSTQVWRAASMWPAAALAASFAFGVYLGVTGVGGQAYEGVLQVAASYGAGSETPNAFWLDDGATPVAGDLL